MDDINLDFEQAKSKHLLFKSRLRSILYDIPVEEGPVLSHFECSVGKWIYGHALEAYGHIPEMHKLENVHADIHTTAKNLVSLYKAGHHTEARNGLAGMEAIADKLIGLLEIIERKIEENPVATPSNLNLEIKLDDYHNLLKSNAELDKRIKQQIEENNAHSNKYETVLASLHEGIIIQDENGVLQSANSSAERLLGLTFDEMRGRTSYNEEWGAIDEDGNPLPGHEHAPMRALSTGQPEIGQIMGIARPDKTIVWLQVNAQLLINKDTGNITGVVSSFFDISAARKANAELKESENRFRTMMDALPQIAWTSAISGEVTFYNKEWYDYTGQDFESTISWGWKTVIHPDDLQHNLDTYKSILDSEEGGEFEIREKSKAGEYRWHLVRIRPIKNESGDVQFWIGTATDIHEIRLLQQQKDDFISIASHELKTPITTLKAALQLLNRMKDKSKGPAQFNDLIEKAFRSSEKVGFLVDDLLNVSKLNHGSLELNKTSFNMAQLINDCCQPIILSEDISIIIEGEVELVVFADVERISQVIINFVTNAVKYAPASKEIKISIANEGKYAKVAVKDKGPGIIKEKLPMLFERYFRVEATGIHNSGLGLGLYICSEIIKKHNGEIGADSKVGKGSTFWFKIPLNQASS